MKKSSNVNPDLISHIVIKSSVKPHYWDAFLWINRDAMHHVTDETNPNVAGIHRPESFSARFNENSELVGVSSDPKLGEIHLVSGEWGFEVVSHELCHLLLHRIKVLGPRDVVSVLGDNIEDEEALCYEFGRIFEEVWKWLWDEDPAINGVRA